LADELMHAPEVVQRVVAGLPKSAFEIVSEGESSRYLCDLYLEDGIVA